MIGPLSAAQTARGEIAAVIPDMIYLSESEAGLELLPADPALDSQERVAASVGAPAVDADAFLKSLHHALDPADDGLAAYAAQWDALFALLQRYTTDIRVYRSAGDPVVIRIAAIIDGEALIIRTTAVET